MSTQDSFFAPCLEKLFFGHKLTQQEVRQLMNGMLSAGLSDVRVAAVLTALRLTTATQEIVLTSLESFREHLKGFETLKLGSERLVDNSGTGGDQSNTVNISSMAAVVAAASGAKIAKFGSRSISGYCGSADVLEALGVPFARKPEQFQHQLNSFGISYLYAPALLHSLQHLNTVRRSLGFHTILDLLLPLANPAPLHGQVLGVYSEDIQILAARCLHMLGRKRAVVVHSEDGLDEISVCSPTRVIRLTDGLQSVEVWNPQDFGIPLYEIGALKGGGKDENKECFQKTLSGKSSGAVTDAVLLNAAATLWSASIVDNMNDGLQLARSSLVSGRAATMLEKWKDLPN
jgi:anthranilate phosphoribosyltransferase